jgi:3-dehydroquinate synthetase
VKGPAIDSSELIERMATDKKAAQGKLRFVVLQRIGQAALRVGIDERAVREAIVAAAQ